MSTLSDSRHSDLTMTKHKMTNGHAEREPLLNNFDTETTNATIAEFKDNRLVKFNLNQTGVFIVNYPLAQWNRYIDALNNNTSCIWQKLSTLDRNNLLSDAFYLSESKRISYDVTLRLAQFLRYERSFVVWKTASNMLLHLRKFAVLQDKGIAFNQWLLKHVIGTLYDELGWDALPQDDLNRRQLRALILHLTCLSDHEACLQIANSKFTEFRLQISNKQKRSLHFAYSPDPDTFDLFLYHTMRTVKEEFARDKFDFLMHQYQLTQSTSEKLRYLQALCAVQSSTLLKELDTKFLRSQDYFTFLFYLSSNPIGLEIGWKSFRDNYPTIANQSRFGLDDANLGWTVYRFAEFFNTKERLKEVDDFYAKYPKAGAGKKYRKKARELIERQIWRSNKFFDKVIEHFTTHCDTKLCPWNVYRLTNSVVPQAYHLTIQVNTKSFLYNGSVVVEVNVLEPVKHIILHAANILKTSKPSVRSIPQSNDSHHQTEYSTGTGFRYEPLEFYVIPLKQPLAGGRAYRIEVSFEGDLKLANLFGMYSGHYSDGNTTVNIVATQFEPTNARKVFPCFDEPHFTQSIHTTIIHEKAMNTTLSNMPIVDTKEHSPGWMMTTFQPSVKMATYLIGILVSDFQCTHTVAHGLGPANYVNISTCASKVHKLDKHKYSLAVTPVILHHYQSYLNQSYQIEKLDQIALPQFHYGAMENWGLVKYREKMLLWTEGEDTSHEQQQVAAIIAHELAHMWFGNLVTSDFWGERWLKEAFASYMEYAAVASVHPDWNYFDTIVYYDAFWGMLSDSIEGSQSLVLNVSTPAQMSYSPEIVYNKGSAILHMFNTTMGKENFQTSLRDYLHNNQYKSVVTDALFKEFSKNWKYNKQNVSEFLHSWTYQPGFPYLNITHNSKDHTYSYTQEKFLKDGSKPKEDTLYVVPFSYYTFNDKTKALESSGIEFLSHKNGTLPIGFANFTKVNPNFNGFYLVNYPEDYWSELSYKLLHNSNNLLDAMTVNDRAELLISSSFAASGYCCGGI